VLYLVFFVLYLNILVVNGHLNLGLKFIPCFDIYPLELDRTYVSGFLLNALIITLTNMALLNFAAVIFARFGANSAFVSQYSLVATTTNLFNWARQSNFFPWLMFAMFLVVSLGWLTLWILKKFFGLVFCCWGKKKDVKKPKTEAEMKEMVVLKNT
jgi:hypothetical protein